jgi:uncharacterized protein (TIGR02588 family)
VIEWTAFGVGTALTIGIAGFLTWQAFQAGGTVDLRVEIASVESSREGANATVRLHNAGDAAAQEVEAEVCDASDACVSIHFDQVPAGATVEHVLRFPPGAGPFEVRVVGWRVGG